MSLLETTSLSPICKEHTVLTRASSRSLLPFLLSYPSFLLPASLESRRPPPAPLCQHFSLQVSSCRVCGIPVRTRVSTCWPLRMGRQRSRLSRSDRGDTHRAMKFHTPGDSLASPWSQACHRLQDVASSSNKEQEGQWSLEKVPTGPIY